MEINNEPHYKKISVLSKPKSNDVSPMLNEKFSELKKSLSARKTNKAHIPQNKNLCG